MTKTNTRIITKDSEMGTVPCGYAPDVMVEIRFKVSNVLGLRLFDEMKDGGYKDKGEFCTQAIIEKCNRDYELRERLYKLKLDNMVGT